MYIWVAYLEINGVSISPVLPRMLWYFGLRSPQHVKLIHAYSQLFDTFQPQPHLLSTI
jgi:hypothetical protein